MRSEHKTDPGHGNSLVSGIVGWGLATSLLFASATAVAADYSLSSVSGESTTILRMRRDIQKQNHYPLYEYLRLNVTGTLADGSGLSFHAGGWGRIDLADKATEKYNDADLQYGYLSYRGARNNTVVNAGRQFVSEGVASEWLDGLYIRNDFAGGVGAAAFVGKPVHLEPSFEGGDVVYGARLTQGNAKYYTIGLSALKSDNSDDGRYREEEGIDLWVHPLRQVDITGRSTYNSVTSGWMEHAYNLSYTPFDTVRLGADFSKIDYDDYFYRVTTTALSLTNAINRNEEMTAVGGSISYDPIRNLTLAADYRHYEYDIDGKAGYYGGKIAFALPQSALLAGLAFHRMDGETDRVSYSEYRAYIAKKFGNTNLSADFIDVRYDNPINGIKNSYAVMAAALHEVNENLKVGANLEFSRNPDFDDEVRGLVKVIYAFDRKPSEGGGKSEK